MLDLSYPTTSYEPFWGPPSATIDWCEENYLFTPYIAEVVNAFTNIGFVLLATHHIYSTFKNRLGWMYIFISLGFASVGLGSFMFHSTLLYEHQMMDELPMVWVTAIPFGYLYGWKKGQPWEFCWNAGSLLITSLFTYIYIFVYRNPAFHQIFYAALNFALIYKSVKTIKQVVPNKESRKSLYTLLILSLSLFGFGFLIWNLDNIYCSNIRSWRRDILGWPFGILLEGHGWWHVFTGLGIYYFILYNMILSTYMTNERDQFTIKRKLFLFELERNKVKTH